MNVILIFILKIIGILIFFIFIYYLFRTLDKSKYVEMDTIPNYYKAWHRNILNNHPKYEWQQGYQGFFRSKYVEAFYPTPIALFRSAGYQTKYACCKPENVHRFGHKKYFKRHKHRKKLR